MAACRHCLPIPGPGVRISYTPSGAIITSTAKAVASGPDELLPFTVRSHQPDNAAGQWEIYMPLGCVWAYSTCTPINAKANDTSGHDSDNDNWYVLPFSASPSDGDVYDVVVHAKQRAIDATDIPQNGEPDVAAAALAWIQKRGEPENQTDSEKTAYAGDAASVTVASITWHEPSDGGNAAPSVAQSGIQELSVPGTPNQEFDLWWAFSISGTTITVPKMGLLRRTLSTGTNVATINEQVDVSGASKGIFLRVVLNGTITELTVVVDASTTTAGANFFIVQLYGVDDWHRASDYRSSLWRLPMYLGGV